MLNNTIEAWIDDLEVTKSTPDKPKEYLEFNTPPLALVIAMQDAGKDGSDIYQTLMSVGKRPHIKADGVVSFEHQKRAGEIYEYFSKKHTVRRIKNEYVSEYMLAVDDLCENRKKIDAENVKILVSLPRIYYQNRTLERVMKGRKSAPKPNNLHYPKWVGEVEFVEKVQIKTGHTNEMHYFFSTPKNYLMRIVVKKGEYGETAWNTLSKAGKLSIDTKATYTYNVRGYNFNVIQPMPTAEIKIV